MAVRAQNSKALHHTHVWYPNCVLSSLEIRNGARFIKQVIHSKLTPSFKRLSHATKKWKACAMNTFECFAVVELNVSLVYSIVDNVTKIFVLKNPYTNVNELILSYTQTIWANQTTKKMNVKTEREKDAHQEHKKLSIKYCLNTFYAHFVHKMCIKNVHKMAHI